MNLSSHHLLLIWNLVASVFSRNTLMCQLELADIAIIGGFCYHIINYVKCPVLKVRVWDFRRSGLWWHAILVLVGFSVSGVSEANSIHSSNSRGLMASILPWATAYFRRTREQKEVFTHIWEIVHLLQCSLEHINYYLISNANRYAIDTRKSNIWYVILSLTALQFPKQTHLFSSGGGKKKSFPSYMLPLRVVRICSIIENFNLPFKLIR